MHLQGLYKGLGLQSNMEKKILAANTDKIIYTSLVYYIK